MSPAGLPDAVLTGSGTFTAKNNLDRATLAPTTVGLTSCSITAGCTRTPRRRSRPTGHSHRYRRLVDAEATATVNGVDQGPSTNDPSLGHTFLASGDRSTIEYAGSYPIDIHPLQAPKAP